MLSGSPLFSRNLTNMLCRRLIRCHRQGKKMTPNPRRRASVHTTLYSTLQYVQYVPHSMRSTCLTVRAALCLTVVLSAFSTYLTVCAVCSTYLTEVRAVLCLTVVIGAFSTHLPVRAVRIHTAESVQCLPHSSTCSTYYTYIHTSVSQTYYGPENYMYVQYVLQSSTVGVRTFNRCF